MRALGIDTSNYTCSAAIWESDSGRVWTSRQLLPVENGKRGLRQSDAVFAQTKRIGKQIRELFAEQTQAVDVVGVSVRPRDAEGSYMPCFLVGESVAQAVSAVLFTRLFSFSHQQGHVAAALFSAGKLSWLSGEPFLAFHVSGGTTESLLVQPGGETIFKITRIGTSLDLKAGQLIDRVGVKLGLSFPAGAALDRLAMNCREEKRRAFRIKTARKGADVCLSGAENLCDRMIARGDSPEEVAAFCLLCVQGAIEGMLQAARERVGNLPVVFAGGVMCSRLLREHFGEDTKAAFAKASYSSDNAVGTAVLAGLSYQRLCVGQGA